MGHHTKYSLHAAANIAHRADAKDAKAAAASNCKSAQVALDAVPLKSKYSLNWASAVAKVKAANRLSALVHASRREDEGAPTGGTSRPNSAGSEGRYGGISSSRPPSSEGGRSTLMPKINYSLTTARAA